MKKSVLNPVEEQKTPPYPILIAEDDRVTRTLLEKILAKAGYEVVSAENGRKALTLFDSRFFPMVLTDWIMPEMNGPELCRAIRKRATPGYVFIVLLTVKDSKYDTITGLESGADDYLTKPFNRAELIARLKTGMRILDLERSLRIANEAIRTLAITDPLTGCYNRTYLNERMPMELNRARRYRHPLSMVLCDIDHFKKINDIYGHHVGDHVLKEFAGLITKSIRNTVDWIVRYGGEEFLIILPESDLNGASNLAERLRRIVSEKAIYVEKNEIRLTASFGVTGLDMIPSHAAISLDTIISQADQYLYQAKQEGRNMVKFGAPEKWWLQDPQYVMNTAGDD
jgi:two-component system cell cycle response regulator